MRRGKRQEKGPLPTLMPTPTSTVHPLHALHALHTLHALLPMRTSTAIPRPTLGPLSHGFSVQGIATKPTFLPTPAPMPSLLELANEYKVLKGQIKKRNEDILICRQG